MTVPATALRELHRIHRQIADLRGRLERGPKQIRAGEAVVKQLEQEVEQAKHTLTRTRVAADEKQLQLKQREDRIKGLQLKLNECGNNREYQRYRNSFLENAVLGEGDDADARFRQIDELRYALRSVYMFAPWIRRIFICTDSPLPDWLDEASDCA